MIDFLSKFPYETCRPEQEKVLNEIADNWDKKKYFIIEAPVGIGKSGIAKAVANACSSSFIITETKQLQEQYMRDFKSDKQFISIKGKANYECKRNPRLNCENGPCNVHRGSGIPDCYKQCMKTCNYFSLKEKALKTPEVLTNYAFLFKAFSYSSCWTPRQLMVFDECHLLEDQLVNFASFELNPKELNNTYGLYDRFEDRNEWLKPFTESGWEGNKVRFEDNLKIIDKVRLELWDDIKHELDDADSENLDEDEIEMLGSLHKLYFNISRLQKKMAVFKEQNKDNWIIAPNEEGALVFTPLYIDSLFNKFCKNWAQKFLFMSATILDTDGFINELGINKEECLVIKMDSTFDPAKSPIYFMPCGSMSYANIDKTLPKACDIINKILISKKDVKGIIHTGNYKVAKTIYNSINNSRLLMKVTDEISNQNLLNVHIRSKNSVLMSPSMTTGLDLKDDLSRFQIIVKLPFESLADNRIKTKSNMDSKWYSINMLKMLIQACGRSTRSAEDYSTTYILDSSFAYYFNKYKKYLPKDFVNRIKGIE